MFWLWNGGVEEEFQCCGGALNTSMKGRQIIIQDVHCLLSLRIIMIPTAYIKLEPKPKKIEHKKGNNSALATFSI